jgi:hypothetical protein
MSDFIDDCVNGDALLDDIDDYVDRWHGSDSSMPLYSYLGMSKHEYSLWLTEPAALAFIVKAKRERRSVTAVMASLNELPMAARSADPSNVQRVIAWLKAEGLWEDD